MLAIYIQSLRAKIVWRQNGSRKAPIDTYNGLIIGNFYNCILPGNLGEGVRAHHFAQKHRVGFARSLAAIFTEKWIDAQMFVLLSVLLFTWHPFTGHYVFYAIGGTCGAVLVLTVLYRSMRTHRAAEKKLWKMLLWALGKAGRFLYRLYRHTTLHIAHIKQRGMMPQYILLGLVVLVFNITQFWLLLQAADVRFPVGGAYTAYLTAVGMMIIAFIPSAPSNIGVLHYGVYSLLLVSAAQQGISPQGDDLQRYALFAVYVHLSYFVPEVLLGVLFLIRERRVVFGGR